MYRTMKSAFLETVNCVINLVLLVTGCYCGHVFGEFINGTEIMTIDTIGPKKCGQHSLSVTGCLAYNYDREMLQCHLLADNSTTGSLLESKKILYKNRESIPLDMHGLCINAACPTFAQCVKLSSGQHTCVRHVCDDAPPPIVSKEGVASRKRLRIGTNLQYTCSIGGETVTNNITCKSNRQWTPVNNQCECGNYVYQFATEPRCKHHECEARFKCDGNNILQGSGKIKCNGNSGTWITSNGSKCIHSGCPFDTPVVMNSQRSPITCTPAACNVTYECLPKYNLHNSPKTDAVCNLTETEKSWTPLTMQCHYECAANRPYVYKSTLSDPYCSTTCTYICPNGYRLVGQSVRNCTVAHGWDNYLTSCIYDRR